MGVAERLYGCMVVERASAEIYSLFAERFAGDSVLWTRLAEEELEHEQIFQAMDAFGPFEDIPTHGIALPPEHLISRTMKYLEGVLARLHTASVMREEVFDIALKVEQCMVESYLNEIKEIERFGRVEDLGMVAESEQVHIEIITRYMQEQKLAHYS